MFIDVFIFLWFRNLISSIQADSLRWFKAGLEIPSRADASKHLALCLEASLYIFFLSQIMCYICFDIIDIVSLCLSIQ